MRRKLLISMCSATLGVLTLATASLFGAFVRPVTAETAPTSYGLYVQGKAYDNNHQGGTHKTFTWKSDAESIIPVNAGDEVATYVSDGTVANVSSNVMNLNSDGVATTWYSQYGQPEYYYAGLPGGAYRGYEFALTEAISVADYDLFTFDVLMNVNGSSSADAATQLQQQKDQLRGNAKDFPVWVYLYGSNGSEKASVMAKKAFYGIDFYTSVNVELADCGLSSVERIAICTHYANGWNKTPQLDGGDYFTLTNFNVLKTNTAPNKTLTVNDSMYSIDNVNPNTLVSVLDGYTSATMSRGAVAYGKDPVPNSDYKYQTGRITTGRYITVLFEEPIHINDYKYADLSLMIWPQGAEGNYLQETATSFTLKAMKYATTSIDNAIDTFELPRTTWMDCRIDLAKYADADGYVNRINIAYADNNAYNHAEGTTQSQYSINIVAHNIDLIGCVDVTFDGADTESQKVTYGEAAVRPADPEKDGYTFVGWTLNGDPFDFTTVLTESIALKANWVENEPESYMLYQNSETLTAAGGKSFSWVAANSSDRVLKHNGNFIRGSLGLSSQADSAYYENADVHGTTPESGIGNYRNFNTAERFFCGIPGGGVTGFEAKFEDLISVKDYPLMTFELIWLDTTNQILDAKAYLYAYGNNGEENVQVSLGEVTYRTDIFTTAYLDFANSGLETVSRIAIAIDFGALWNAGITTDGKGSVNMQNFTVHKAEKVVDGKVLSATENDMWAYNAAQKVSLLSGVTQAKVYRANDGSVSVGGNINGTAVAHTEYKYSTNRITVGKYIVMTFRNPIKVSDYEGIGLRMWAHPQGADSTYLNETATAFTFKVLRADATDVNSGKAYTLARMKWTEMVLPLADYADANGYVEKLIILYADNNAEGHAEGTEKTQYSINMMMHSVALYTDVEYEVTFDSDGGSSVEQQVVVRGGAVQEPVAPTKFNYNFTGWTLNGAAYDFNTVLTSDVTLKATWEYKTLGETLKTMNVNLGGKISSIFKYSLPADIAADANAYVSLKINGREKVTLVKDAKMDNGYYFFEVDVAAAEMTKDITVQLFDGDGKEGTTYVKTVRDYADYIIQNGTEQQVALVKAMLNYGAYAQIRFGVNTDNLANAGCETDITSVAVDASKVASGAATGFALNTYDLILEAESTIRLYFTADQIADLKITVAYNDGEDRLFKLVPAYDDANERYYVDIPNVAASLLDREYTIKVVNTTDNTEYTVTLSALCYVSDVLASNATTDAQKNVVKALYLYNQAANEFFEN